MLALELGTVRQHAKLGLDRFDLAAAYRHDVAERLALLGITPPPRPGEAQFIVKVYGGQYGLHNARQRWDAVLGGLGRTRPHQIPARFGVKQPRHVKRQNAVAEVAERHPPRPSVGRHPHRIEARAHHSRSR